MSSLGPPKVVLSPTERTGEQATGRSRVLRFLPPLGLTLPTGEFHVWYLLCDQGEGEAQTGGLKLLSGAEIERARAFRSEPARREYLATRAFVRTTLGRYLGRGPETLLFQKSPQGRPELVAKEGGEPLYFNVSHSGGLIACAVGRSPEIGIDVEAVGRDTMDDEVAERFFAKAEVEDYRGQPTAEARRIRFLEYWTVKEAYLKARGLGLVLPLERIVCGLSNRDEVTLAPDPILQDDVAAWRIALRTPAPGFVAAIAVRDAREEGVTVREMWVGGVAQGAAEA